jgi:hypothetical protein
MYYFATMYNATIKLPKCKYDVIILLFGNIPINIFQDGVYRKNYNTALQRTTTLQNGFCKDRIKYAFMAFISICI